MLCFLHNLLTCWRCLWVRNIRQGGGGSGRTGQLSQNARCVGGRERESCEPASLWARQRERMRRQVVRRSCEEIYPPGKEVGVGFCSGDSLLWFHAFSWRYQCPQWLEIWNTTTKFYERGNNILSVPKYIGNTAWLSELVTSDFIGCGNECSTVIGCYELPLRSIFMADSKRVLRVVNILCKN